MFKKTNKKAEEIKKKILKNFENGAEDNYTRIKNNMLNNIKNKSDGQMYIDALKMLIKEKCSAKPKFYGLMLLRDLMEKNDKDIVKYFAIKISDRLKKILKPRKAQQQDKLELTCLDHIYKTQITQANQQTINKKFSKQFYILLLQCWLNWDKEFSRTNKKIKKYSDQIRPLFNRQYDEDYYSYMNTTNNFKHHLQYVQDVNQMNHLKFDQQSEESFNDYKSDNLKQNSSITKSNKKKQDNQNFSIKEIQSKIDQLYDNLKLLYSIYEETNQSNYNDQIETILFIKETILQDISKTPTLQQIQVYANQENNNQLLEEVQFLKQQNEQIKLITTKKSSNKDRVLSILKQLHLDFQKFQDNKQNDMQIRESKNFDLYETNSARIVDDNKDFKRNSQNQYQEYNQNQEGSDIDDAINDFENGPQNQKITIEEDQQNFKNFDGFQDDFDNISDRKDDNIDFNINQFKEDSYKINHFKDDNSIDQNNINNQTENHFKITDEDNNQDNDFNNFDNKFQDNKYNIKNDQTEFENNQHDYQNNLHNFDNNVQQFEENEQFEFQNFEDANKLSSKEDNQYLKTIQEVEETQMDSQISSYRYSKNNEYATPFFKNPNKKQNILKRHTTDNIYVDKKKSQSKIKPIKSQKVVNELKDQFEGFNDFDQINPDNSPLFNKSELNQKSPLKEKEDFEFNFGSESPNNNLIKNQNGQKFFSQKNEKLIENHEEPQTTENGFQMGKFTFKGQNRENRFFNINDKEISTEKQSQTNFDKENSYQHSVHKEQESHQEKNSKLKNDFDEFNNFNQKEQSPILNEKLSQSINPPQDVSKTEDDYSDIVEEQRQTNKNIKKTLDNISKYSMRRSSLHLNKDAFETEYQKPDFDNISDQQKIQNLQIEQSQKRGIPNSIVSYKSKVNIENNSEFSKPYTKKKTNISQNDLQSEFDDFNNQISNYRNSANQEFDVDRDKIKFLEEEVKNLTEQLKRTQLKQIQQEEEYEEGEKDYVSLNILRRRNQKLAQQNEYLQKLKDDLKFEKEKQQNKIKKEKNIYKSLVSQYDLYTSKLKSELEMEKAKNLKRSAFIDKLQNKLKDYDDKLITFKQSYHQMKQKSLYFQPQVPKENMKQTEFNIQQEEPKLYINHQSLIQNNNQELFKKQNMTQSLIPQYQAVNIVSAIESQRQSIASRQNIKKKSNQSIQPLQKSQASLNMYEQFFKQLNSQKISESQIQNQDIQKYKYKNFNQKQNEQQNIKVNQQLNQDNYLDESIKDLVIDDQMYDMINEEDNLPDQILDQSIKYNQSVNKSDNQDEYIDLNQFNLYQNPQFLLYLKASSLFANIQNNNNQMKTY